MTEQLNYVQCVGYPQGRLSVKTIKVELLGENNEPAEMLLRFDDAQRLRDDLDHQLTLLRPPTQLGKFPS
jgi:hypothetical protein